MQSVKRVPHGRIPLSPERRAIKDALWSFHFHGAGLDRWAVPEELRPMPLTDAMEAAARWDHQHDEHAADRRVRSLRRLHPEFVQQAEEKTTKSKVKQALKWQSANVAHWTSQYGRVCRTDLNVTRDFISKIGSDVGVTKTSRCLPRITRPDFDPKTGCTKIDSSFEIREPLTPDSAWLLDPRSWDVCSDLFDNTYQVDGETYERIYPDPQSIGRPWSGFLYEEAGVGPQTVENILWIDFRVTDGRYGISGVDVEYQLYDSLTYELAGMVLPGLMRQNHGYLRASPSASGRTEIKCRKEIRFARWTEWSGGGGAFDYGEMLNYLAPAYLSLWIYDVTQVVPCCKKPKKALDLRR